jgi:formyl-CoA transferase
MSQLPAAKAFSHLRILDLSRVRAGPTCVRQFADFGADVIKIEPPLALGADTMMGPRHGSNMQNMHRNKRALTLNIKDPRGLEIFFKLVKSADVVVENYRPDVKFRLGIDYESLKKINRRIILASVSGFGEGGPYRDRPGFDQIAQGMGGLMSVTGFPGEGPVRAGAAVADFTAGLFAALGIMTAIIERERSGEGQWVQSNLLQSQIALLDFQAARYLMTGVAPQQAGNDHPTGTPVGTYKASDGYLNIAAHGETIWQRFCKALMHEAWIHRPEYQLETDRTRNRELLTSEINRVTAAKTVSEWIEILNGAGVPCGPVYSIDQMFADPQVQYLNAAVTVKHRTLGDIRLVNQAVQLSRTPAQVVSATPELGEHTEEILTELKYSTSEIEALREAKVI